MKDASPPVLRKKYVKKTNNKNGPFNHYAQSKLLEPTSKSFKTILNITIYNLGPICMKT